jgi:hypothetical protein
MGLFRHGVQDQRKPLLPVLPSFGVAGLPHLGLAALAFTVIVTGVGVGRVPEGIREDFLGLLETDPGPWPPALRRKREGSCAAPSGSFSGTAGLHDGGPVIAAV